MNPRLNIKAIATVTAALAATFALSAIPALAQQKQTPPPGGPPKPFTVPAHETYDLPNGMKVTLVPYGNLPKATLSLVVRTGNLNEPADMPGLADLTGKLMKEGTTSKSSKQVAEDSANMGGAITITVGVDESDTLARFKALRRELVDPKIDEHRGRIVKTTGDGLLAEFASVIDALHCAIEVQRGMQERSREVDLEKRIVFRIGINVGDVVFDGGDIYGDGVNVAARLEALAEPGGICVSG